LPIQLCDPLLWGTYNFNQCTLADYWGVDNTFGQRGTPLLYMNNGYLSATNINEPRPLDSAYFRNCIIYGALNEEVGLDSSFITNFHYYFENCVIKTQQNTFGPSYHYSVSNWVNLDPLFNSPSIDDYQVDQGSPALLNGNAAIGAKYKYGT